MDVVRKNGSRGKCRKIGRKALVCSLITFAAVLFSISCTQIQKPEPEPFFAQSIPPKAQEFRWSNGRLPKSFDPALAAAPPETDVVRALYEGLTETDPTTLNEVPGVAESWTASDDHKTWTFKLRKNAKWSNGKSVTANDFVRAWKRLVKLGDKTANRNLLSNIVGVPKPEGQATATDAVDGASNSNQRAIGPPLQRMAQMPVNSNTAPSAGPADSNTAVPGLSVPPEDRLKFGVTAEDEFTLKVSLNLPDKEFPRLVANPIFRPIFNNGEEFVGKELDTNIVTNGPFRVTSVDQAGLVLEPSANYWNRDAVKLERVKMVAMDTPEQALAAYRAGELDAITNADLSPLVLKLLSPYDDFRKMTHSALNFYQVNTAKAPFSDRRVREALSNAIERDRLTEAEMDGATRPALGFLPYSSGETPTLTQDREKARDLLDQAGFPDGAGFPVIKLIVNRNDTQQRVARSVAKMWKQNLNLETEIVVKETAEVEKARTVGDFDLVRRGAVFPTSDQTASLMAIFEPKIPPADPRVTTQAVQPSPTIAAKGPAATDSDPAQPPASVSAEPVILTEADAIYELRAIPLYFPTSFALVKPYVDGFDTNSLDAIALANVAIDSNWRPRKAGQ